MNGSAMHNSSAAIIEQVDETKQQVKGQVTLNGRQNLMNRQSRLDLTQGLAIRHG